MSSKYIQEKVYTEIIAVNIPKVIFDVLSKNNTIENKYRNIVFKNNYSVGPTDIYLPKLCIDNDYYFTNYDWSKNFNNNKINTKENGSYVILETLKYVQKYFDQLFNKNDDKSKKIIDENRIKIITKEVCIKEVSDLTIKKEFFNYLFNRIVDHDNNIEMQTFSLRTFNNKILLESFEDYENCDCIMLYEPNQLLIIDLLTILFNEYNRKNIIKSFNELENEFHNDLISGKYKILDKKNENIWATL